MGTVARVYSSVYGGGQKATLEELSSPGFLSRYLYSGPIRLYPEQSKEKEAKYPLIFTKGPHHYTASCPVIAGCSATGETLEQTVEQMQRTLATHLKFMIDNGDTLPALVDDLGVMSIPVSKGAIFESR